LAVDEPAGFRSILNDWRCTEREAALVKNLLVPACVDFPRSPRADGRYPGVLDVCIDVEAICALAGWPEPAAVNLVLKKMPLSAVIEIDGFFVRPRCG
jgi:hypothetical protein